MNQRVLVAGIGNIFLGDDAFGVEVVRELMFVRSPTQFARQGDFGIRSYDLCLCDYGRGYETTILVDRRTAGQPPGTLYLIEPDLEGIDSARAASMLIA